jgi:hypothetical protein
VRGRGGAGRPLISPELSAAAKNTAIPAAENKITTATDAVTVANAALKKIPAKLPASQVTPGARKAILATQRCSLQMVLRLLAAAAGHWLGNRLNDYLRDPDEYRAITRHLPHLDGTITSTPRVITVTLDPPAAPRIARALLPPQSGWLINAPPGSPATDHHRSAGTQPADIQNRAICVQRTVYQNILGRANIRQGRAPYLSSTYLA